MITGTPCVDLSASYDIVNHRLLIHKLYIKTQGSARCRVLPTMLSNMRLYVEHNNGRSRWRNQKNDLLQGSVLSYILFNIVTTNFVICCSLRFDHCDVSTVVECCVKNNSQICWSWGVFKFFAATRDVQVPVGFPVSDMEYACMMLVWVGTQVVFSIVFANVM